MVVQYAEIAVMDSGTLEDADEQILKSDSEPAATTAIHYRPGLEDKGRQLRRQPVTASARQTGVLRKTSACGRRRPSPL
jgi:hypothetical protein